MFLVVIMVVLMYPSFSTGIVILKITDSGERIGGTLFIRCRDIAVHRVGEAESIGWISLANQTERYDLVALGNASETIARLRVPTGRYDKIRFSVSEAVLTVNGTETNLGTRAEKFASPLEFSVTSKETVLVIDFRTNFRQSLNQKTYRALPTAHVQT